MNRASDLECIERRMNDLIEGTMHQQEEVNLSHSSQPLLRSVWKQAKQSNESGKRLRALLALACFDLSRHMPDIKEDQACGGRPSSGVSEGNCAASRQHMIDLACAIELFQTSALIHDDIIDESDMRRGKASAHKALSNLTGDETVGNGLAILLGDLLAATSVTVMQQASTNLFNSGALVNAASTMQESVAVGQIMDMSLSLMPLDDANALEANALAIYRKKTASYTSMAPIEIGLLAAGVNATLAQGNARAIGLPLGLAFQLTDDLVDIIPTEQSSGKPLGGDIREGKRTLILADTLRVIHGLDRQRLIDLYQHPKRSRNDVDWIIGQFHASGAIHKSIQRVEEYWRQTKLAVSSLPWDSQAKKELLSMCSSFVPSFHHRPLNTGFHVH